MVAFIATCISNKAYANPVSTPTEESVDTDRYSLTPSDIFQNRTWERKPGGWRYLDIDGKAITGHFFDNNGDMYCAKENGYIIMNGYDEYGQYYDSEGRLYNAGYSQPSSAYNNLSEQLESGNNVYFKTSEDLYEFMEYYGKVYNIGGQNLSFKEFEKRKLSRTGNIISEEHFINNSLNKMYDREKNKALLQERFPERLVGNNIAEKLNSLCEAVKIIKYNEKKITIPLEECLTSMEGGCWHFIKVSQFLLEREGIHHEIVTGTSYGVPHIWLRVKDESGKWIYCDPTFTASGIPGYTQIDWRVYMDNYRVYRFFGK